MNHINSYRNTKNELAIIKLRKNTLDEYEKSFKMEKETLNNIEEDLSKTLHTMDNHLKDLDGIENRLYYEIVVKGSNVTKAIDYVAFKEDKDVSTIWKYYYPRVKKKIEELSSENQVD